MTNVAFFNGSMFQCTNHLCKAEKETLKKRVCAFGVESMMQWIQELIKRMNDVEKTNRS